MSLAFFSWGVNLKKYVLRPFSLRFCDEGCWLYFINSSISVQRTYLDFGLAELKGRVIHEETLVGLFELLQL